MVKKVGLGDSSDGPVIERGRNCKNGSLLHRGDSTVDKINMFKSLVQDVQT